MVAYFRDEKSPAIGYCMLFTGKTIQPTIGRIDHCCPSFKNNVALHPGAVVIIWNIIFILTGSQGDRGKIPSGGVVAIQDPRVIPGQAGCRMH